MGVLKLRAPFWSPPGKRRVPSRGHRAAPGARRHQPGTWSPERAAGPARALGTGESGLRNLPPRRGKVSGKRTRRTIPKFLRGQQSAPPPVYPLRCRIALLMVKHLSTGTPSMVHLCRTARSRAQSCQYHGERQRGMRGKGGGGRLQQPGKTSGQAVTAGSPWPRARRAVGDSTRSERWQCHPPGLSPCTPECPRTRREVSQ